MHRDEHHVGRDDVRPRWGMWTGIAAIALIAFLGILFIMPQAEPPPGAPGSAIEKTTPAPSSTPTTK
jgi:hypothetical protein